MPRTTLSKNIGVVLVFCTAPAISLPAQTFTSLASFNGTKGSEPGGPVQGADGNFYGPTYEGGKNASSTCASTTFSGCGTLFKVTPAGTLTTFYSFCSKTGCSDGSNPDSLLLGSDGNFYGHTAFGGTDNSGTVFKITPGGTLTTLYSFCSQTGCADGYFYGTLLHGSDGNFYGTTWAGGTGCSGDEPAGCGTVFKITPGGALTTLHSFDGTDGSRPTDLIQGTDGNFYGTTGEGGAKEYAGTVFRITPSGQFATPYSFCTLQSADNCLDGYGPGPIVQGADGSFYGTTYAGGGGTYCTASYPGNGCGTVFKLTPSGKLTTLYNFCSQTNCTDGWGPDGLVHGTDENFYGAADGGGAIGIGTLFKITPSGTLTTLHSFDGSDGGDPGGLVQSTDGTFYGATGYYGTYHYGTLFSLSLGLAPFVETLPTSGATGATVVILGNNLTGATGVTFNGVAAAFTVVSSSEITTTVPDGGTTGTVMVRTPGGVLDSNIPFQVTVMPSFTISVATGSSTSQTVDPGGTAKYVLSLASQGGLNGTVTLSCSGAPSEAQCAESPSSVALSGNSTGTSTISVSTAAPSRVGWRMQETPPPEWLRGSLRIWVATAILIGLLAVGWAKMQSEAGRNRFWDTACLALALVLLVAVLVPACGGGSSGSSSNGQQNQGTPAGTYNLTVTGTYGMGSSTLSQTQTVLVQPEMESRRFR
jgi:uncharacterized repeat protein (TIGR03803 family)